jgi:predicted RNA-binding Zn-ribbon protein involved in translation (DUF1610 family)
MAKFKIKVKVTAECEYEVEVERETLRDAEDAAVGVWRDKLPSDFQIDKGYITDWDVDGEQQTADCPDCGVEHVVATADRDHRHIVEGVLVTRPDVEWWLEDQDYCAACGAKIEAEEKING